MTQNLVPHTFANPRPFKAGDRIVVYNRYLFAVPVKGVVVKVNDHDPSVQVIFDTGQHGLGNVNIRDNSWFFEEECRLLDDRTVEEKERERIAGRLAWMVNLTEFNYHTCVDLFKAAQLLHPGVEGRYGSLEELRLADLRKA